ncbi:MAG: trypsin-like cysteine/serine peptidase domain-containing protein, partial [Piptocephalis tieghemiana]
VVTAAHCLIDVNTVVASTIYAKREVSSITLGVGSLKNVTSSPLTLQSAIIHPNYDAVNQTNDIALLQLTSPLSFSPAIQPIRVHGVIDVAAGTNVTALGWGATETEKRSPILRSVSLTTTQGARCTNAFPDYSASESNLVCIGGSQGKDTCYGDSGGPL